MKSFQQIIFDLKKFWSDQGCAILEPIDIEVGAGTLHPATVLRALGPKPWKVAYVQPCRRPTDARYGRNPNRLSHYYQFQVLIKPAPTNIKDLYFESLKIIGLDVANNDIRFVEDDWQNPTVGASGLGFEVWFNGMEVTQFTYMQQIGGIACEIIPVEITYGLERIAMHIQGVNSVFDIDYDGNGLTYGEIFLKSEQQNSHFILEHFNASEGFANFNQLEKQSQLLIEKKLSIPAYESALKASHTLNLLDARGALSTTERASYISRVRNMVKAACELNLK